MAPRSISKVTALLQQAIEGHHRFEREQLNGEYDREWPAWYANHLLQNGLGRVLRREISAAELAALLEQSTQEHRAVGGGADAAAVSWAEFTAGRIVSRWPQKG